MNIILYSISISLFDSLSTTLQIIIFILLLTTDNPIPNALSYLTGLSGAYFACGIVGYLALDDLRAFLGRFFPSPSSIPDAVYYQSEFLIGLMMVGFGIWFYFRKKKRGWSKTENRIISRLRSMNVWVAFVMGLLMSLSCFPVSIPYLVVLGRYSALHLELPAATGLILIYNLGYALPMVLVLAAHLKIRRDTAEYKEGLHEKAKKLNAYLTTWSLVGFGLFSMIDAGCYFTLGQALLKDRFF
jgi:cytochrome c biogenesis protein CcdA